MSVKYIKKNSASKTNLTKLIAQSDQKINDDDNPETDANFWSDAEIFMPKHKILVSIRLDEDVVNFFKDKNDKYQSKINAVLKAYMHQYLKHHA